MTADTSEHVDGAMSGLFRRDSLYMVLWAIQIAAAAGLTPLITRVLGVGEFGTVAAANAVMQVLFFVAGLGLSSAIQREYAKPDGAVNARRLLLLVIVVAVLITVAVDATGRFWHSVVGFDQYAGPLRFAVWWAGISAVTNAGLALLRSQDRLAWFAFVSLLQSIVAEALSVVLLLVVKADAYHFVLGQLIAQIAATGVALVASPPARIRPRRDRTLLRTGMMFALPLVPSMLSTFVLASSDRIVLLSLLGESAAARYQVAYNIGSIPMLLLSVLHGAWMPRIFAISSEDTRAAVLAASRDALFRILVPVVVGLSFGAPIVLRLWAPTSFRTDSLLIVTALVIVSVVPFTAGLSVSRALLASGNTVTIAVANVVAALVNLALNIAVVPHFQLVGSAAATLISYSLLYVLLVVRARVVTPMPRPSSGLLAVLTLACGAAVGSAFVPESVPVLVVRGVVAVLALGAFGLVVRRLIRR